MGERASRYGKQYRLTWDGYDQTYDTWETVDAVVDSQLIDDFEATIDVSMPLKQPMGEMRENISAGHRACSIAVPFSGKIKCDCANACPRGAMDSGDGHSDSSDDCARDTRDAPAHAHPHRRRTRHACCDPSG